MNDTVINKESGNRLNKIIVNRDSNIICEIYNWQQMDQGVFWDTIYTEYDGLNKIIKTISKYNYKDGINPWPNIGEYNLLICFYKYDTTSLLIELDENYYFNEQLTGQRRQLIEYNSLSLPVRITHQEFNSNNQWLNYYKNEISYFN